MYDVYIYIYTYIERCSIIVVADVTDELKLRNMFKSTKRVVFRLITGKRRRDHNYCTSITPSRTLR